MGFPQKFSIFPLEITAKTATTFFGSDMTPPTHSEVFRKFIQNRTVNRPFVKVSHHNLFMKIMGLFLVSYVDLCGF